MRVITNRWLKVFFEAVQVILEIEFNASQCLDEYREPVDRFSHDIHAL